MTKTERKFNFVRDILIVLALVCFWLTVVSLDVDMRNLTAQVDEYKYKVEQQSLTISKLHNEVDALSSALESAKEVPAQPKEKRSKTNWKSSYVAKVVAAEAGNKSLKGQMAVAQTIRERADAWHMTYDEVVNQKNQYTTPNPNLPVTKTTVEACERVFDNEESVCAQPIKWFYSTAGGFYSDFHESKDYVMTVGNHKFFE